MGRRWMGSRGWELTVELGDEKPVMRAIWTVSSRQGRIGLRRTKGCSGADGGATMRDRSSQLEMGRKEPRKTRKVDREPTGLRG
jgi:hypothetical protein